MGGENVEISDFKLELTPREENVSENAVQNEQNKGADCFIVPEEEQLELMFCNEQK